MENSSEQDLKANKPKKKPIEYTVSIGNHLFERISKHVYLLKYLKNDDSNKLEWVQEAIKEKLKAIEHEQLEEKFLHLKLDSELWHELEKTVGSLKNVRRNMSKKALIEEAIFEKLDREEQSSKNAIRDMLGNI